MNVPRSFVGFVFDLYIVISREADQEHGEIQYKHLENPYYLVTERPIRRICNLSKHTFSKAAFNHKSKEKIKRVW